MFKHLTKACLRLPCALDTPNLTIYRLAGHSKWQNIRHIKGAKDAARSLLFTKLSRQMKVAIQEGGSTDIKKNSKLENVIEQAKRANMPSATIQSVLKSCEQDKSNSKSHLLEIKGPGGCIILCEVFTSNLHTLKQNISSILKKHKGRYSDGGGMHLFEEKGVIVVEVDGQGETLLEAATDHAIEAGAEDVKDVGSCLEFICGASSLNSVVSSLEKFNYKIQSASIEYIPLKVQELDDEDMKTCASLCDKLEGLPEVVRLSDNVA